jgi:hypothetical protein
MLSNKKNVFGIALLSLIIAFSSCEKEANSTPQSEVVISGTITDSETGSPLNGVSIQIDGAESGTVVTDPKGYYRFDKVVEGKQYTVIANVSDYYPGKSVVKVRTGDTKNGDLTLTPSKCLSVFTDFNFSTNQNQLTRAITNKSNKDLSYSLSTPDQWIVLTKTQGSMSKNANDYIRIDIDRSKLPSTINQGIVTLNHDAGCKAVTIYVTASK